MKPLYLSESRTVIRIPYVKKRMAASLGVPNGGAPYTSGDFKNVVQEVRRRLEPSDMIYLYGLREQGQQSTVMYAVLTNRAGTVLAGARKGSRFEAEKGYWPHGDEDEASEFLVKFPASDIMVRPSTSVSRNRRFRKYATQDDDSAHGIVEIHRGKATVDTAADADSLIEDDPDHDESDGGRKLRPHL